MLKKVLLGFVALICLVVAAAIVLPIIFKDDLIKLVNEEASKNLNAELSVGDIDVSMFENFPDFTLTIEEVNVVGVDQFEGVTLADIDELKLSLDIMSVISGSKIQINTIGLERPELHVIVLADGTANYDIAPESEETEEAAEETDSESAGFNIGLSEYYISHANIIYDDRAGGMYAQLVDFSHSGSGDFTQDDFILKTKTDAKAITYKMDGVSYLSRTALDMKFDLNMNLPNMRFEFLENYVTLNALHLGFDGMVSMPDEEGDPIDLDLTFETKETTFKSILSLVPAVFMTDFEDIETNGSLALNGMAKGRMIGDQLPAFDLKLTVADGMFHYPDLPKSAENIQIDLRVQNLGGSDDNTIVDVNSFHVELAGNPVDVTLHMRTPISDPYINTAIMANLDMGSLADVIPLEEGQALTGTVISDINLEGNQSAIDEERYEDFHAGGSLVLRSFNYEDPALPYATVIETCSLLFSPQFAELTAFDMLVGESDISMVGRVDNIVEWYVSGAPLSGSFDMSSSYMNLNEFMEEDSVEDGDARDDESSEESSGVVEVPAGYDFVLNTSIKKMLYEDLEITNVRGQVVLRDQKIDMTNLAMNLLDGSLNMNGSYATSNPARPDFDMNMDIVNWDIPMTYEYLDMVQKMAPIMESATGKFSTNVKMAGQMDENMEPIYGTLDGGGLLMTQHVSLSKPSVLQKAAAAIKYDKIQDVEIDDLKVKYYFEDGRIKVDPTQFVIGREIPSIFGGSHGFDMTLDYVLNLDVPTKSLPSQATQVMDGLLAKANSAAGTSVEMPESIKIDLDIDGMMDDPKVTPRMAGTENSVKDNLKDKAKEELDKQKEDLERQAREEADKAKAEAEAKAQEEIDKAKAEAEKRKKAAEEEARKKAEEAKKKAEAEAKKKADAAKKKAEDEAKKKLKGLLK